MGSSVDVENVNKPRCVPRKLPLQMLDRSQLRAGTSRGYNCPKQIDGKPPQLMINSDLQRYWDISDTRHMDITDNGLHWEMEDVSNDEKGETIDVTIVQATTWSGQWHPQPDNVQPCSSKAIDPYVFP